VHVTSLSVQDTSHNVVSVQLIFLAFTILGNIYRSSHMCLTIAAFSKISSPHSTIRLAVSMKYRGIEYGGFFYPHGATAPSEPGLPHYRGFTITQTHHSR
jgi:hypothetical protein